MGWPRVEDGIAGEYNQEPSQVVQLLAVHYELREGTRDHSAVKKIIRCYKNGLSNLYSFPRACLWLKPGGPNGPRGK